MSRFLRPFTQDEENDPHTYQMQNVLDPPQLNALTEHLERTNILWIDGRRYFMDEVLMTSTDGHMYCRLAPVTEQWEIGRIAANPVDTSARPF